MQIQNTISYEQVCKEIAPGLYQSLGSIFFSAGYYKDGGIPVDFSGSGLKHIESFVPSAFEDEIWLLIDDSLRVIAGSNELLDNARFKPGKLFFWLVGTI